MGNFLKTTGCAFNVSDMFYNFSYEKLKLTCKQCQEINGCRDRDKLVKQIFRDSVDIIINDIIDNNVTFELPVYGKVKANIHMNRIQGDDFKKQFKFGKWRDIDFLKSYFTGYQLALFMSGNRTSRVKPIYISGKLKHKITENTNNGKQYC